MWGSLDCSQWARGDVPQERYEIASVLMSLDGDRNLRGQRSYCSCEGIVWFTQRQLQGYVSLGRRTR